MKKYDLCIIGAGASGLTAAISAKMNHKNISVLIIEHLPKVGKKILATGNGRCNLTNINAFSEKYNNPYFANDVLKKYPAAKVTEFFNTLGLFTYTDSEGRVYPRSNNASSVLDALRFKAENLGVEFLTEFNVDSVSKSESGFIINKSLFSQKLIIACGGKSSPSQGSNGSGYPLASSLGHSITKLYPALVPLVTDKDGIKSLKGVRAANISINAISGNNSKASTGEILFTDSGVSGIAAMELASFCEKYDSILNIDFLPEYSLRELKSKLIFIQKSRNELLLDNFLTGLMPKAIGIEVLKKTGVYESSRTAGNLSEKDIEEICSVIKKYTIKVRGSRGFSDSQVTSGGVSCNEINSSNMMSLIVKDLYFCGEIIDIDGPCGGYNLQWAFASGLLAGELN